MFSSLQLRSRVLVTLSKCLLLSLARDSFVFHFLLSDPRGQHSEGDSRWREKKWAADDSLIGVCVTGCKEGVVTGPDGKQTVHGGARLERDVSLSGVADSGGTPLVFISLDFVGKKEGRKERIGSMSPPLPLPPLGVGGDLNWEWGL